MRTTILAFYKCAMLPAVALATSAYGAPEAGGYLGLKAGYSKNEKACEAAAVECDSSGGGYGIFGGYNFSPRFAVELGYTDVSDPSAVYPERSLEGEISLLDISAKYSHAFVGETAVFAKLGAAFWQGEVKGWSAKVDGSGFSPSFGVGVEFPFAERLSARVEYQYFGRVGDSELGHTQPHFLSAGLSWHFGSVSTSADSYPESYPPTTATPAKLQPTAPATTRDTAPKANSTATKPAAVSTARVDRTPGAGGKPARVATTSTPPSTPQDDKKAVAAVVPAANEETPPPSSAKTANNQLIVIDDHSGSPLFTKGSTVLKINYELETIAVDLLRNPNLFVHIIVHTDDQGDSAQNQQLSKARGDKLVDYLVWQGVNPDHITVEGKGEADPVVKNNSDMARARNRRAEFFISETRRRR